MTDVPATAIAIRILKTGTCPSLSGKSRLTYEIACSSEAGDDLALRVATNTGGGFFSDEWLPLAAVEKIVTGSASKKGLTSTTLHPLFKGKSINTAGFLLAVLKAEGAVQLQEGKTRLYEVGDFEGFLEATRGLLKPVSEKPKGKAPKAVSPAAKTTAPAAKATPPARKSIQRAAAKRV
jgi:hypothetical protein